MFLERTVVRLRKKLDRAFGIKFPGSGAYWNRRYVVGGNSGPGSYGHLAEFKASFLNEFVTLHDVRSVIEFGCGDGNQLALAIYSSYFGVDVSTAALSRCRELHRGDETKRFAKRPPPKEEFDLALSLDVIYHLVEDDVFDAYMHALFRSSHAWVVIYSSNMTDAEFVQCHSSNPALHVKHRRFSDWIEVHAPSWRLLERTPNRYPFRPEDPARTAFAEFFAYKKVG